MESELFQAHAAEHLECPEPFLPAHRLIETAGEVVVRERPHKKPFQFPCTQTTAHFDEQRPAEASSVTLRFHVEFGNLAHVRAAVYPASAEHGVADDPPVKLQQQRAVPWSSFRSPPARAAPRDHSFESNARDDPAISVTPSLGVKLCEGNPVAAFRHSYGREANHLRQTMQTAYLLQQDMAVTVTRGNPLSARGTKQKLPDARICDRYRL